MFQKYTTFLLQAFLKTVAFDFVKDNGLGVSSENEFELHRS